METKLDLLVPPIHIQLDAPERFARAQVVLRVLVLILLTAVCQSGMGLWGLAYVALPLLAAVAIERHGPAGYFERLAPLLLNAFEWLIGLIAYMLFVTDRLPLSSAERPLRIRVQARGEPSVRSALGRLVTSLPHFVFIALAMLVSGVLAMVAAVSVLFSEHVSGALRGFQLGMVNWISRVLVYHASLAQAFPPVRSHDDTTSPSVSHENLGEA